MPNPAGLLYAKVVGRYQMFVGDGADGDDLPDFLALEGFGEIVPDLLEARNTNPGQTSIYLPEAIPVEVVDGDLSDGTNAYVMVLASSPGVTPEEFTYRITLDLRPVGSEGDYTRYGPYSFQAIPDEQTEVVDLAIAVPVTASMGVPVIVGPRGPGNLIIQPTDPELDIPGMWVQTGLGPLGEDFTIWIEDGL